MLIELWEKLRGYDKWIEATATIQSSEVDQEIVGHDRMGRSFYEWRGDEELVWTDSSGIQQREFIQVGEDSPVFRLYEGKSVRIRYKPEHPSEFYVREELAYRIKRIKHVSIGIVAIAGLVGAGALYFFRD